MKTGYLFLAVGIAGLGLESSDARAESAATLGLPIEVTTQSVQAAIEQAVPANTEKLDAWEFHGDTGIEYGAWRGPISVVTTASTLRVVAQVEYAFRACQRVNKPWPLKGSICPQFAQCGFGEPRPQIEVTIDISGTWSPSWAFVPVMATRTSVLRPCRLTLANIDVSDRATGLLRSQIEAEARKIEQMLQFHPRAEQVWNGVAPKQLADQVWLSWQLDRVSVEPLHFNPGRVGTMVTLAATPTLTRGQARPPLAPLPSQLTVGGGGGASAAPPSWRLGADASWGDVTSVLKPAFDQYSSDKGVKASLRRVSGSADGRVHAEFALEGAPLSALSVSANLRYDPGTDTASLDQLKLETDTAPLGEALVAEPFLAAAQARMRWQLQPLIQPVIVNMGAKLSSLGVVSGQVGPGARVEALSANTSGLSMAVTVPGRLQLQIVPAF